MAFNPTGDRLAVGTATEVYLRDANTGEESTRIPHPDNVNDVSFSADGNTLITVSSKILQFWDIAKLPQIRSDDLVSTACSHLIENFDIAQWSALFGGQKYRKLCENLPVPEE
jgi:WD40 repeat protein